MLPIEEGTFRPHLHDYVFISFSSNANFSLRFHLASTPEGDQKRLKTVSKMERFKNEIVIMIRCRVERSFSLKTQTFENNATRSTSYSNYFDTQTIDFRCFLPFLIVFIVFV